MSKKNYEAMTPEMREGAVKMVVEGKERVVDVARRLEIESSKLHYWVRLYKAKTAERVKADDPNFKPTAAEFRKLQKDLERITQERDFLKKAAAYFAKDPQ